jgi:glycosyltransferase involved in cell wall biosynthesis
MMPATSVDETRPQPATPIKIAHLTPFRDPFSERTFAQSKGSVRDGFEVVIVAPYERDESRDGVRVRALPKARTRLDRITRICLLGTCKAMAERPDIYHLHEPDLVPWGLVLRLFGKHVIYDVHEDYVTATAVRPWLPGWARPLLASGVRLLNILARRFFVILIAERYYRRSFPDAVEMLNYAKLEEYDNLAGIKRTPVSLERIRLLYAGSITESRGARHHLRLLDHLPAPTELLLIGQCSVAPLAQELATRAAGDPRLRFVFDTHWLAKERIFEAYAEAWTAGLALFPDSPHYREKELTKFYEYMAAGLPIVCSNFPVWRELVEGYEVGLCVDPEQPEAAAEAIRWLAQNPQEAKAMGARGRCLVQERFNWDSQMTILNNLYRRMLAT